MSHYLLAKHLNPRLFHWEGRVARDVDVLVARLAWGQVCDDMEMLKGQLDPAAWEVMNA
jgi:hypothetical protein